MRIRQLTPLTTRQIAKRSDNKRAVERFNQSGDYKSLLEKQAHTKRIIEFCYNNAIPSEFNERKN